MSTLEQSIPDLNILLGMIYLYKALYKLGYGKKMETKLDCLYIF